MAPRSPDLNPLDVLLWGYIKQRVHATPPPTLQVLRNRITDACASVSPAILYNVQREVQSSVQMCIVAEGHHFEHDRQMNLISSKCSYFQRDQTNKKSKAISSSVCRRPQEAVSGLQEGYSEMKI
ncbi:hypothetical protein AVEN_122534-1 [Araneus ventricosus]|uniref:Uncharacterized protein n=1 Tax=Araneus ventricosus TaxID=182803 RepID=A0A4Y2B3Y5_ARAVE|nr:hypothetical protein AVEN_122534-1 [Araneus ventricosus]